MSESFKSPFIFHLHLFQHPRLSEIITYHLSDIMVKIFQPCIVPQQVKTLRVRFPKKLHPRNESSSVTPFLRLFLRNNTVLRNTYFTFTSLFPYNQNSSYVAVTHFRSVISATETFSRSSTSTTACSDCSGDALFFKLSLACSVRSSAIRM